MLQCYPLSLEEQRTYADDFDGKVFVWDIDKTYLATRFSSLKGVARIPLEFAVDKKAIAGMPEVLRGLRRGAGRTFAAAPIYFVSASPPQMRRVIERKMLMDGVEYDGIAFKDWAATILGLRPGRLREQVGFKLCALLTTRQNRSRSREYLFGDDVESDAEAFHLYARLLAGELSAGEAEEVMKTAGVKKDDRDCVRALLDRLGEKRGSVERIFIHLAAQSAPERFADLAPAVVPVKDAFQLALACYELGLLRAEAVGRALDACRASLPQFEKEESGRDALERGLISKDSYSKSTFLSSSASPAR